MFDLMAAIKREYKTPPPADSADSAENAQPRGLQPADNLRKVADFSASNEKSANVRKNPQTAKSCNALNQKILPEKSANPQNPQPPAVRVAQNPDDLLADIAAMLQADPGQLRALLSADDVSETAQGFNSLDYMLDYFRQMRTDGKLPTVTATPAPQSKPDTTGRAEVWEPAHEAMTNHLTDCTACYAPKHRYCEQGAGLHRAYHDAHHRAVNDTNQP
ncbi:MAG: hypothetical protein MH186_14740 [Marinobacter sp.]|jgi:hypothetical protein|nr:hypothetical protein [Marinobacter sp.]